MPAVQSAQEVLERAEQGRRLQGHLHHRAERRRLAGQADGTGFVPRTIPVLSAVGEKGADGAKDHRDDWGKKKNTPDRMAPALERFFGFLSSPALRPSFA
jgi:hypothetical protein